MYVNVFGEVTRPGRIELPNEKFSILDALAMAGDLTISGRRENILIVREENGHKMFTRVDINDTKLFQSPYYYLRSGDAIYVQPNKAKSRVGTTDTSRDRYVSYLSSFISISVLLYTVFSNSK